MQYETETLIIDHLYDPISGFFPLQEMKYTSILKSKFIFYF